MDGKKLTALLTPSKTFGLLIKYICFIGIIHFVLLKSFAVELSSSIDGVQRFQSVCFSGAVLKRFLITSDRSAFSNRAITEHSGKAV